MESGEMVYSRRVREALGSERSKLICSEYTDPGMFQETARGRAAMHSVEDPSIVTHHGATVNGVRLHYVLAGEESAEPLVLLHGFPQSWLMWRLVIPSLAEKYFVVAVDLRGYGDSEKPHKDAGHDQGTKAADIHALTSHLGLERAVMVGHDRGGRVARRYALDYPGDLSGVALLDILPSEYVYDELTAAEAAQRYWHWIFQIVPDLPEQLIAGNEDAYLERFFGRTPGFLDRLREDGAYGEYRRAFLQPGAVAAALQDYRDTFDVDVPRYRAEREAGRKVTVPTLLLWGDRGNLAGQPVQNVWRQVADDIAGAFEIPDCGHYLPEEKPEIVIKHLLRFAHECFAGERLD
jgi:haloacetate dehalogenase